MPERAHVKSTEAIEAFRADLIAYLSKAKPVVEDVFDEVARLRDWLERDRRTYWEQQLRRRAKVLNEAQQALFSARLLNLRSPTTAEQTAVTMARRTVAEAESKLRVVKKWLRDLDNRVQPLLKELEHVRTMLSRDLPAGTRYLAQIIKRLDEYRGVVGQSSGNNVIQAASADEPGRAEDPAPLPIVEPERAAGPEGTV
jgi:hypothetical protein